MRELVTGGRGTPADGARSREDRPHGRREGRGRRGKKGRGGERRGGKRKEGRRRREALAPEAAMSSARPLSRSLEDSPRWIAPSKASTKPWPSTPTTSLSVPASWLVRSSGVANAPPSSGTRATNWPSSPANAPGIIRDRNTLRCHRSAKCDMLCA